MKSKILFPFIVIIIVIGSLISISSCTDMFKNPLEDKDTGEDITLLIVDMNFIKTKIAVHIIDSETGEYIEDEEITIIFGGDDAANLINFAGEKPDNITTSTGYIELGYDPRIEISPENPLELTIYGYGVGYLPIPVYVSYPEEGIKDIIINLIKIGTVKSEKSGFNEPYTIYFGENPVDGQLTFLTDVSHINTGADYKYLNCYQVFVPGLFSVSDNQNPNDAIGLWYWEDPYVYNSGRKYTSPETPVISIPPPNLKYEALLYTAIKRSGIAACDGYSGLTFNVVDGGGAVGGSGAFNYKVTYSNGTTKTGIIRLTIPQRYIIHDLNYPESDPSVKVELFGDSQYNMSGEVSVNNVCGGEATFEAIPISNLFPYKIITKYKCPDMQFAVALTISGQFKKSGSDDPWTSFTFDGGICELQLEKNEDYDFRMSIDGEWTSYTLPTDPSQIQPFIEANAGEDYSVTKLDITTTSTLITIDVEVELDQDICDIIG
ncbi:hypothetical protein ACFLTI_05560 [Bacteroidota bacterium]